MSGGGDDLDENYLLDDAVALASDDEHYSGRGPDRHRALVDEDDFVPVADGFGSSLPGQITRDTEDPKASKKRKAKQRQKENKRRKLDDERHIDPNVNPNATGPAFHPPPEIADYLRKVQQKTFPGISDVELEDIVIPEQSIVDTTSTSDPRPIEALPEFIRQVLPQLHDHVSKRIKQNGAPVAIIVAGAALRVADLVRTCRPLRGSKGAEIAKLFAKHIKPSEQIEWLKNNRTSIAIGTPERLNKLLAEDALKTNLLQYLILDITHRDPKHRNLLDIPETRREVLDILGKTGKVFPLIKTGKVKMVLY